MGSWNLNLIFPYNTILSLTINVILELELKLALESYTNFIKTLESLFWVSKLLIYYWVMYNFVFNHKWDFENIIEIHKRKYFFFVI